MRKYDLVCFDMDGVLTSIRSSWHWINICLGVNNDDTFLAYITNKITQTEFMRMDIAQWHAIKPDLKISDIIGFFQSLPLTEGVQETVACLRSNGVRCVIVSGGVDLAAKMIAEEFGFDDYAADEICSNPDGSLTGEGRLIVDLRDKGIMVRHFIEKYNTTKDRVVSIGNSYTDIPMFKNSGMSIAFNPSDNETKAAATHVVESENISDILELILQDEGD